MTTPASQRFNLLPTSPAIGTGRILYSNPDLGYYEILPDDTTACVDGTIQAMDGNVCDFYGSGITVASPYSVGTSVTYIKTTLPGEAIPTTSYIIVGTNKLFETNIEADMHKGWDICIDKNVISTNTDIVLNAFLQLQTDLKYYDRSYGVASDLGEGDYLVAGSLKNNLRVGQGVISVSGGYINDLTFFTETNGCVFSTEGYYIHDTLLGREEVYADYNGEASIVKQYAHKIWESFGTITEPPFKKDEKEKSLYYIPTKTGAFPIYSYQELGGAISQGKTITIASYAEPKDNVTNEEPDILKAGILSCNEKTKASDLIQFGVSNIRTPWDGSISLNSLNSISFDKDIFIPFATQIGTESNTDLEKSSETIKDIDADVYSNLDGELMAEATQAASALYEYSKLNIISRFFRNAVNRIKAWKLRDFKEVIKALGVEEMKTLPKLGRGLVSYVSNLKALFTDPITMKHKMMAEYLSAFIHIAPSGAIVISDGHGAEIRLEGGNITISPSGDLKILPGRDVIGFVPGRIEVVSRDRIDVASDTGAVSIKADKDATLLSRDSVVSLESMSTKPLAVVDEKTKQGGGIVLKSSGGVGLIGTHINMRCQGTDDKSKGREDFSNGGIIVDSNGGPLLLTGKVSTLKGDSATIVCSSDSALSLTSALSVVSNVTSFAGTVVVGGAKASNIRIPQISKDGVKDVQISIPAVSKGQLLVDGAAVVTDGIVTTGALIQNLGVGSCRIKLGCVDNASGSSGKLYKKLQEYQAC